MRYVDYTTNEVVYLEHGFADREFVECKREPYTPERLQTLKSMDEALEEERMKLPTPEIKKDATNVQEDSFISLVKLLIIFIFGVVAGYYLK